MTAGTDYCSTLEVFEFLRWDKQIPDYPNTTTLEEVDTSGTLASGSKIYLDHGKVIDGTQTISYGASAASVTDLTETAHYTIDNEKGEITITAAGATAIGANNVYATYKYTDMINDDVVGDIITRISRDIDKKTSQTFGTLTLVDREEHGGQGAYRRLYNPLLRPVHVVTTQLNGAVTATGTAFVVDSTTGLEAGDKLIVEQEVVTIDSVTDSTNLVVTRGAIGSGTATHVDDTWTCNLVVEVSNTPLGGTPSWNFLEFRDDFDVDSDTGAVQLLHVNAEDKDDICQDVYPLHSVFNRVRITYKYGTSSVPIDIKRACILMVAYELMLSGIAKNLPEGVDGFTPTAHQQLWDTAMKILSDRKRLRIGGF